MKKRKVKILKLITGEEILGVYIKSGLFTMIIEKPVILTDDGSLTEPNNQMLKYTNFGDWNRVKIKKSSVISVMDPIPEMIDYYESITIWIDKTFNENIRQEVVSGQEQIKDIVHLEPKERTPEEMRAELPPELQEKIYLHVLEQFEVIEGVTTKH